MKNQSHKLLIYGVLFFVIINFLVMCPNDEIHAQQPRPIKIGELFSNSQVIFPFVNTGKIYRLALRLSKKV